jgi:hypothetical protein
MSSQVGPLMDIDMRDPDPDELCFLNRFNPSFSPQSRLDEGVEAYISREEVKELLHREEVKEFLRRRGRRVNVLQGDKVNKAATVTVDHGDGTCDLLYDDGEKDHRLNIKCMTPLRPMEDPKVCAW